MSGLPGRDAAVGDYGARRIPRLTIEPGGHKLAAKPQREPRGNPDGISSEELAWTYPSTDNPPPTSTGSFHAAGRRAP